MVARGGRGGPRRGAPAMRGRGARPAPRGRGTHRGGGIQKTQATRTRPIQPRIAADLQSTVDHNQRHESVPAVALAEHHPSTAAGPQVNRIIDQNFMCSSASLFFVSLCGLQTSPDTETITLNLMDHFLHLSASYYPPELRSGHLHAVCFLLASELTGCENEVQDVCRAVEMQAAGLAALGAEEESLKIHEGQVLEGLRMVVGWSGQIRGCVGGYWEGLEGLFGKTAGAEEGTVEDEVEVEGRDDAQEGREMFDFDTFDDDEV